MSTKPVKPSKITVPVPPGHVVASSSKLLPAIQRLHSTIEIEQVYSALQDLSQSLFHAKGFWILDCSANGYPLYRSSPGTPVATPQVLAAIATAATKAISTQQCQASSAAHQYLIAPFETRNNSGVLVLVSSDAMAPDVLADFSVFAAAAVVAVRNAELHALTHTRNNELQQLLRVCSELGSTANVERFMENFVVRAAGFLGFARSFLALAENGKCQVRYGADSNQGRHMKVELTTGITLNILQNKRSYRTENALTDPGADVEGVKMFDVRQYLGVPIYTSGQAAFGVLALLDKADGSPISDEDVERAESLAAAAAVALQSAQMLHEAEVHRQQAESLVALSLDLNGSVGLPNLIRNFVQRAMELTHSRAAALALARGMTMETVLLHDLRLDVSREHQNLLSTFLHDFAESHTDTVISSDAGLLLGGTLQRAFKWEWVTIVRLCGSGGELLGILVLADHRADGYSLDRKLLQAFTSHAAVALENSRLFSRIAQSSKQWAEIFDSLADYIVVHDDEHRVMRVNRPMAEYIGVRPQELIGIHMRHLLSKGGLSGKQPCQFCLPKSTEDEGALLSIADRTYVVSTSRVHGALNEGLQTIHVLRDVTDTREAERRYHELFETIQEGAYFSTPEGRFQEVNDALVRMLGYASREELLAIDIPTQMYTTRDQRDYFCKATDAGVMRNKEVTLRRKDGSVVYGVENAVAVRHANGDVIQYRGLIFDITETKRFQAQLQRERDFNHQILNNTQSMILVADTAGLISYANRRSYEAGSFAETELVGNRIANIIAASDRVEWDAAFDAALQGDLVDNLEVQVMRGNGSLGKFAVNMSPMRGEQESVNSIVVLMTDITDLSTIQAKLMNTEKLAAVGQLVSGVAHEVNNPLTAIMGFSDLMLENPELPESVHKDLMVIVQEAQRTKEIVQNLLSFARQMPPQRKPVDINAVLRRTIALRSYDFSSHGVDVLDKFDPTLPEVVGDSHQLQQVFLNILNNAYDAVRDTERRGRIEIETTAAENSIEVRFRDNGPGIASPEKIFDPFFTTKEVGKGTGLGLSICYGIVRQHHGDITCYNNTDNAGATFCVRLPVTVKEPAGTMSAAGGRP